MTCCAVVVVAALSWCVCAMAAQGGGGDGRTGRPTANQALLHSWVVEMEADLVYEALRSLADPFSQRQRGGTKGAQEQTDTQDRRGHYAAKAQLAADEIGVSYAGPVLHDETGRLHVLNQRMCEQGVSKEKGRASPSNAVTAHCRTRRHTDVDGVPGDGVHAIEAVTAALNAHAQISSARAEHELVRVRRTVPSHRSRRAPEADPLFSQQWYLQDVPFPSLHTWQPWTRATSGTGAVMAIVDDGLEHTHPDLADNYNSEASYDFNDNDPDPFPRYTTDNINRHGTRCAGVAGASRDNGVCGTGVAFTASLGGIRMLDGPIADSVEANSFSHASHLIDIYSNSWGPADDGKDFERPGPLALNALERGARYGRNGLGSIYVFASGNGGSQDDCNADGYANSIFTIAVSAVDEHGQTPYYIENCAPALASTFSSGSGTREVVATDLHHECTTGFSGTSAAAPQLTAALALAVQQQPCMQWHQAHDLVVRSASSDYLADQTWTENAAGLKHNRKLGFGVISVERLTHLANQTAHVEYPKRGSMQSDPQPFRGGTVLGSETAQDRAVVCAAAPQRRSEKRNSSRTAAAPVHSCIGYLHYVEVLVEGTTSRRGDMKLVLVSPSSTSSLILSPRYADSHAGSVAWSFKSAAFWGESCGGEWELQVSGTATANKETHMISKWQVICHGLHADLLAGTLVSPSPGQMKTISRPASGQQCRVCPESTYPDGNGSCRECHESCSARNGCFGPGPRACLANVPALHASIPARIIIGYVLISFGVLLLAWVFYRCGCIDRLKLLWAVCRKASPRAIVLADGYSVVDNHVDTVPLSAIEYTAQSIRSRPMLSLDDSFSDGFEDPFPSSVFQLPHSFDSSDSSDEEDVVGHPPALLASASRAEDPSLHQTRQIHKAPQAGHLRDALLSDAGSNV